MKPVTSLSDGFICITERMEIDTPYIVQTKDVDFVVEYNYQTKVMKVRIAK